MDYQQWEFFEEEVNRGDYDLVDAGPLFQPVTAFTVRRDKQLKLLIETTSAPDSLSVERPREVNAVYQPEGQVRFKHRYRQATFTLDGVSPMACTTNFGAATSDHPDGGKKVQTSGFRSIHWSSGRSATAQFVVEWLENLSGSFIWPHSDNVKETTSRRRTLEGEGTTVVIPSSEESSRYSQSCAYLRVGGCDLIIGQSRAKPDQVKAPGFILYMSMPSEELRAQIRGCLSYCLGDCLIPLGSTAFDSDWRTVSCGASTAYALVEEAAKISGRPPSPLGTRFEREIDPDVLGRMASALLKVYEPFKLRSAFWNFWHAAAAPVHMAAAHYGAAIEALQRTYFDSASAKASPLIVPKEDWREVYAEIDRCIQASALDPEAKAMLGNKAKGLNIAPQGVQFERFFAALGLEISPLEKDAWANRNRAAHGSGIAEDRVIQTIRENEVLMMLMHRILLAISGANSIYYDAYTLGRPKRHVSQSVPDDRAGVAA